MIRGLLEREQLVVGLVASCRECLRRSEPVEGSLFHAKVGVQVGLSGVGGFVAEPERNGGDVDSGVETIIGVAAGKERHGSWWLSWMPSTSSDALPFGISHSRWFDLSPEHAP
jgi:hypothetical protein